MNEDPKNEAFRRRDRAVAIQYEVASETPKVLAAGVGQIARQILRLAEVHNIPVHEDEDLAELMSQLPVGAPVSDQCLEAVAEILCFLYASDREYAGVAQGLISNSESGSELK